MLGRLAKKELHMSDKEVAWYKNRTYLHFDPSISKKTAQKIVTQPNSIKKHAFYPFIRFSINSQKIRFDKTNKRIERKPVKERQISYASHLDSHIYSYYSQMLSSPYEAMLEEHELDDVVLAFRAKGKSNIHFAQDAFNEIAKRESCCVIGLDIKGFFDNLNHQYLKEIWCSLLKEKTLPADHYSVFKSLTHFSYVDRDELYEELNIPVSNPKNGRTRICTPEEFRNSVRAKGLIKTNKDSNAGIPQGSPISALLSNIYMLEFDKNLQAFAKVNGGKYFRYCDDMLLIVPRDIRIRTEKFAYSEIGKLKLEIQKEKNEIRIFNTLNGKLFSEKPLQYLGFTFDGRSTLIRSASLARYYEHANRGVRLAAATMEKYNTLRIMRGEPPKPLHLKKLYKKYSYLGRRNFLSYGYRAAKIMSSSSIKKQLRQHWKRLQEKISKI